MHPKTHGRSRDPHPSTQSCRTPGSPGPSAAIPPTHPPRVGLSLVNVYSGSLAPAHRHGNHASCAPPPAPPPRGAGTSPRVGSPRAPATATTHPGRAGLGDSVGSEGVQGRWGSPPPRQAGVAGCHPGRVTAPTARPRSTRGCGRVLALPTRLGAALFINRRSRGLGGSCTALTGHPARRHAATEPAGTTAPVTTGDNGEDAAHGAGRARGHPDATPASPRTRRAAGAARGDIRCVPKPPPATS